MTERFNLKALPSLYDKNIDKTTLSGNTELKPANLELPDVEMLTLNSLGSEEAIDEYLSRLSRPVAIVADSICVQPDGWEIMREIDHREGSVAGFYVGLIEIMVAKSKKQFGVLDHNQEPQLVAVFGTKTILDIGDDLGEEMLLNDIGEAGAHTFVAVTLDQEVSFEPLKDNLSD